MISSWRFDESAEPGFLSPVLKIESAKLVSISRRGGALDAADGRFVFCDKGKQPQTDAENRQSCGV